MKQWSLFLAVLLTLTFCCAHAQTVSYTTRLSGSQELYLGPGYAYGYAQDVGEDGTYTIVEEQICDDGYLWGRLKSGAGWVMLKRVVIAEDSYTVSLRGKTDIYEGPGYGYSCTGTVGEDGVYTIVSEYTDSEGNEWGKLKSGAGWVVIKRAVVADTSYTARLNAGVGIYEGPGFDSGFAGTIDEDGVYTIVEEQIDDDYNVWGRLKSGAGWVFIENDWSDQFYTVQLGSWVQIYEAPGYDFACTGDIGEDGVYTIISEYLDDEGNCWGQLKSGAGWVDLTRVRTMGKPVITASIADEKLLSEGGYTMFYVDESEYAEMIAFRSGETLWNVRLTSLLYDGEAYIVGDELHYFDRMIEGVPFVAGLPFWGELTTYGLSFMDEAGAEHYFAVYLSGRNGSVILEEYVP